MKNLMIIICSLGLLIAGSTNAAVHYVPTDYPDIQTAIDAAVDGDTVAVTPGTYFGSGNHNISFKGKAITVQSTNPDDPQVVNTTVIDCQGSSSTRAFIFQSGETSDAKLVGLTITGGNNFLGGGIYCYNNSSPTISNCVITDNSAVFGGAVAIGNSGSEPTISACTIKANTASVGGGAIYCIGSSPTIESCIIAGNFAPRGGAIYSQNVGNPVIANCTISANAATVFAGGIYCYASNNLDISNCILWDNTAASASEMLVGNGGAPAFVSISYCDIQGLTAGIVVNSGSTVNWGQGNIDLDPMFVSSGQIDPLTKVYTEGDYHLLDDSPCIDAGAPVFLEDADQTDTDIDGDPRLSGAGVDIGADEVVTAETIEAIVKVTPKTLNLTSNGNWITCTVALGDNYDIGDVVLDSIKLNDELEPVRAQIDEAEQKLLIKFDREETQDMLSNVESPALMTVSGKLADGMDFEGDDTIKLVTSKGKK
ncbi:MAG: hypothetical protein DRP65_05295 [Planctomycetota bacterium]|nr:MAG: hypothetical protein DRP65_05295 [Planctomycetota bacterium]